VGASWKADSEAQSLEGPIRALNLGVNMDNGAHLNVYLCKDQEMWGVVGRAWMGVVCKTSWRQYYSSINERRQNEADTAAVLFHIGVLQYLSTVFRLTCTSP
jgi:hypothetical protein